MMGAALPQLGRFLSVGALNTAAGLLVIYATKWVLQWGDIAANATGYGVGLILSFVLNSRWTFRYQGAWRPALARFSIVMLLAYAANLAVVLLAIHVGGANSYIAQAIGILPYTITAYLGSKYCAFVDTSVVPRCRRGGSS